MTSGRLNKKRASALFIITGAALLVVSGIVIKLISDNNYRTKLPEWPDFKTVSVSLKEQILEYGKKAYRWPSSNNLGRLGMVYHSNSFYDKAISCYQLAVKRNINKWKWSYYLGYINLEMGNSSATVDNFKNVIKENPGNYLACFYIGEAYLKLGLIKEAEKNFEKIALNDSVALPREATSRANYFPLRTYAMLRLARIYMNTDRLAKSENMLRNIIKGDITFGPAYRLLGNVYSIKGDSQLSRKYSVRANDLTNYVPPVDILIDKLTLMSRSEPYLLKQIDLALTSYNPKWAKELLDHGLPYIPDSKFLISKAINLNLKLGSGNKVLQYLDEYLRYPDADYGEIMEIASLLFRGGFRSQAMTFFQNAKKIKSEDPGSLSGLAIWLLERGMTNDALILINEQLKKDPMNEKVLTNAVYFFLIQGEKEKAAIYLNKLNQISSSNPLALKFEGMIAEKKGEKRTAISKYELSFKIDPKDLANIRGLGDTYIEEKMWNKVIPFFKQALDIYPNEPYLLEGLGRLLITCPDKELRNLQEGKEYSERAFIHRNTPSDSRLSAGISLASAYAGLGDKQKARYYMNVTINIARSVNVSKDYLAQMESLLRQFSSSP
jgi:tetratricopeptide (TPR) repeat protein